MSFLQAGWLMALIGLAVPIALHLQRRRTKTHDWAAMRFLRQSLTHRRRGLTLEQFLLLFCRCLLLAAFVFTLARPWSQPNQLFGGFVTLALVTIGLGMLVGSVAWFADRRRRLAIGTGGILLWILAVGLYWRDDRSALTGGDAPRDVVLIIDGSDSMGIPAASEVEGNVTMKQSRFKQALEAAERFLDKLPAQSTAAVLIADSSHSIDSSRLNSNLKVVRERLRASEFVGGQSQLPRSIEQARALLKRGQHAQRQIVLLTDDQATSWQTLQELPAVSRDKVDGDGSRDEPSDDAALFGHLIRLPDHRVNLAVTKLEVDAASLRVGQKARVQIEVFNGGSLATNATTVEILLNGAPLELQTIPSLEPGARKNFKAELLFERAGAHIATAIIAGPDDIPTDNRVDRAIAVRPTIPVLIVDGDSSLPASRRSSHYVRLALNGPSVTTELVEVGKLASDFDFTPFQVVVLCDVPMLRPSVAKALSERVADGGGLMVLLGPHCEPDFYHAWEFDAEPLIPVSLVGLASLPVEGNAAAGINITSVQHAAFDDWFKSGEHDLADWTVSRIWQIASRTDAPVQSMVRLNDGKSLLIERVLREGRIVLQTTVPDVRENNFINRVGFPVWMHLLTKYLAEHRPLQLHQEPSPTWIVELPGPLGDGADADLSVANTSLMLKGPHQVKRLVNATWDRHQWRLDLGEGEAPGLYGLSGELETSLGPGPWPLSIGRLAEEADLTTTADEPLNIVAQQIGMELLQDEKQLTYVATGLPMRVEWWRYFAYATLVLIATESLVLMWVARQRGQSPRGSAGAWVRALVMLPLVWLIAWIGWTYGWQAIGYMAQSSFSQSFTWPSTWVASFSCLVMLTYWDRPASSVTARTTSMKIARLLLLGLLGFVLLEPIYSKLEETIESRQVVVLWDQSDSMRLPETASSFDKACSRLEIAERLLLSGQDDKPSLIEALEQDYDVQMYEFASSARTVTVDPTYSSAARGGNVAPGSRWSQSTNLAAALQRVLADASPKDLSGVIVLTDGCDRSSVTPSTVANVFAQQAIPIHSIVIGDQTPVVDAEVVALQVPGQVFSEDQVTVRASLKADQLRGQSATVRFSRDGELLKTITLPIATDQLRTTVEFQDQPGKLGLHRYDITIEPLPSERFDENNTRSASVWVTNDRLRLLIVEQRPRWEFRYLKNLFAGRDRNVALQYVLLSPDRLAGVPEPYPMAASASRAFDDCEAHRLPESEQEWLKFDVIILGDIAPQELDESTQQTLQKFVSQRGGTLIVIAGQQAMPHRYLDSPLGELLPVQRTVQAVRGNESDYSVRLTDDGLRSAVLQTQGADVGKPTAWEALPSMHWRHSASIAKPGATVWAWADDATGDRNDETIRNQALMLWHRYGGGRVLQLNFDETWRLRFWQGDEPHHRLWGRLVRWATEERLGLGTDRVRMGIDRTSYNVGDTVTVKVRLVDEKLTPSQSNGARLILSRDGDTLNELSLEAVIDSGGLLQSRFTLPDVPGRYRVQVVGPAVERALAEDNRANEAIFAEFAVEGSTGTSEANDLVASDVVARSLAEQTGGLVLVPETAHQLLEKLGPKSTYRREELSVPQWNRWPVVTLFFALLVGEWITRRRNGLI